MPFDPDNPDSYDPDEELALHFDPEDEIRNAEEFPADEILEQEHFALYGDRAEREKLERDIAHYDSL